MMKVLEQATRVHCFAEEICNETTREDWQLCAYQLYRWQMDQEWDTSMPSLEAPRRTRSE